MKLPLLKQSFVEVRVLSTIPDLFLVALMLHRFGEWGTLWEKYDLSAEGFQTVQIVTKVWLYLCSSLVWLFYFIFFILNSVHLSGLVRRETGFSDQQWELMYQVYFQMHMIPDDMNMDVATVSSSFCWPFILQYRDVQKVAYLKILLFGLCKSCSVWFLVICKSVLEYFWYK